MNENTFDVVTRDAAVASGRRALLALGGAGLVAALAGNAVADAKKKGKKAKKKCNKQKNQCREGIENLCQEISMSPQECIADLTPCCAECNLEFAVVCAVEAVIPT